MASQEDNIKLYEMVNKEQKKMLRDHWELEKQKPIHSPLAEFMLQYMSISDNYHSWAQLYEKGTPTEKQDVIKSLNDLATDPKNALLVKKVREFIFEFDMYHKYVTLYEDATATQREDLKNTLENLSTTTEPKNVKWVEKVREFIFDLDMYNKYTTQHVNGTVLQRQDLVNTLNDLHKDPKNEKWIRLARQFIFDLDMYTATIKVYENGTESQKQYVIKSLQQSHVIDNPNNANWVSRVWDFIGNFNCNQTVESYQNCNSEQEKKIITSTLDNLATDPKNTQWVNRAKEFIWEFDMYSGSTQLYTNGTPAQRQEIITNLHGFATDPKNVRWINCVWEFIGNFNCNQTIENYQNCNSEHEKTIIKSTLDNLATDPKNTQWVNVAKQFIWEFDMYHGSTVLYANGTPSQKQDVINALNNLVKDPKNVKWVEMTRQFIWECDMYHGSTTLYTNGTPSQKQDVINALNNLGTCPQNVNWVNRVWAYIGNMNYQQTVQNYQNSSGADKKIIMATLDNLATDPKNTQWVNHAKQECFKITTMQAYHEGSETQKNAIKKFLTSNTTDDVTWGLTFINQYDKDMSKLNEEIQRTQKKARRSHRKRMICASLCNIGANLLLPVIAPAIIAQIGPMAYTVAKGAVLSGMSASITKQNIIKSSLHGGLTSSFGFLVEEGFKNVPAFDLAKSSMQVCGNATIDTMVNGGKLVKNVGVSMASNMIGHAFVPDIKIEDVMQRIGRDVLRSTITNMSTSALTKCPLSTDYLIISGASLAVNSFAIENQTNKKDTIIDTPQKPQQLAIRDKKKVCPVNNKKKATKNETPGTPETQLVVSRDTEPVDLLVDATLLNRQIYGLEYLFIEDKNIMSGAGLLSLGKNWYNTCSTWADVIKNNIICSSQEIATFLPEIHTKACHDQNMTIKNIYTAVSNPRQTYHDIKNDYETRWNKGVELYIAGKDIESLMVHSDLAIDILDLLKTSTIIKGVPNKLIGK